eukprot:2446207-Pleurochrysis_carterae.AAC.1
MREVNVVIRWARLWKQGRHESLHSGGKGACETSYWGPAFAVCARVCWKAQNDSEQRGSGGGSTGWHALVNANH